MKTISLTIERSKDGGNFNVIGTVKGSGNSQTIKEYGFVDQLPFKGINYYRLKQTDIDNDFQYLKIIAVSFEGNYGVLIYPNPINNSENAFIELFGFKSEKTIIYVYDGLGRIVYQTELLVNDDYSKVGLDLPNLSGLFNVVVKSGTIVQTLKLLIQ